MGTLTACIKKAGALLHAGDRAAILAKARELRAAGVAQALAAQQAIDHQIGVVQTLHDNVGKAKPAEVPVTPEAKPEDLKAQLAAERESQRIDAENARLAQRKIFNELSTSLDMIGKTMDEVVAEIQKRLPPGVSMLGDLITKLADAIRSKVAANKDELLKAQHRDPAVLASAVDEAYQASIGGGPPFPAHRAAFQAGFQHALNGKTKSTMVGEDLGMMLKGYQHGQEWARSTEEGRAWFEGRPINKLVNTGLDLRRHWELMQAQLKENQTSVEKAWKQIERATARADLFAPLLPDGVTPGFTLYVGAVRDRVMPFKEWLQERTDWIGSTSYGRGGKTDTDYMLEGARQPRDLAPEDREKFRNDEAYRANWLQDKAREYLKGVRDYLDTFLVGRGSVKEAAEKFTEKYVLPKDKRPSRYQTLTEEGKELAPNHTLFAGVFKGSSSDAEVLSHEYPWTKNLIDNEKTVSLPTRADPLTPPRLDRVTRDGPDLRAGKDVTPEQFKKELGVADVGFGKWVKSKQDQDHLNYAYDAFRDLAKHFGTNPENLGFGGALHFTIGALGHGRYAAHFAAGHPGPEGQVQVINVTNTKGDGTVYHEWIHALDWNIGRSTNSVRDRLLSILKSGVLTPEMVEDRARDFLFAGWRFGGKRTQEREGKVTQAVRGMHYMRERTTAYKLNADKLAGSGDYWNNNEELIARAGEAWAADTLGHTNTYLVNPDWVGDGKVTQSAGYRGTPFPTGDERKLFNQAYTAWAKSIKWKNGKPTVTLEDFERNLPDELKAGEARRRELLDPAAMQEFYDAELALREAQAYAEEAAKAEAAKKEQEDIERLAAEKLNEIAPVVDTPTVPESDVLTEQDLSALFDDASAELHEEAAERPDVAAPGASLDTPITPQTGSKQTPEAEAPGAADLIGEAAKLGVKGINEALTGLAKLFGTPGRLNAFGGGFDEETYRQARPHFKAALEAFQAAGKTLKDLFKLLIQQFGDGVKEYAIRFAKDEGLTQSLGTKPTASAQIAEKVRQRLAVGHSFDWRVLFGWADEAHGGTQGEGKYTPKDAYDAMEAGVNLYLKQQVYNPNADRETALMAVAALDRVLAMLPTQTKRTVEQDEYQQFSTVPPLAYMANWVANIQPNDVMMEPSAGIGGLAVFAHNAGASLVLNELSSRRAGLLQEVFPSAKVWTENAEQLNNILPDDVKPTVVVMNPPFSATAGRMEGVRNTQTATQHIKQAMDRLASGGRLVAIVGEGMAMDKPAFQGWWKDMKAKYSVRAAIPMSGAGYAKYGTSFDNVLLVIDKRSPIGKDVVTTRVEEYKELVALLSEVRDDRPSARIPADDRAGVEHDAAESERDRTPDGGRYVCWKSPRRSNWRIQRGSRRWWTQHT
jgi:hypothetical protein